MYKVELCAKMISMAIHDCEKTVDKSLSEIKVLLGEFFTADEIRLAEERIF